MIDILSSILYGIAMVLSISVGIAFVVTVGFVVIVIAANTHGNGKE